MSELQAEHRSMALRRRETYATIFLPLVRKDAILLISKCYRMLDRSEWWQE